MSSLNPHVSRLFIYPIKSLDILNCDRVTILKSGALHGDRTWAIFDRDGNFVNGKQNPKIHALRSQFDLVANTVTLQIQGTDKTAKFNLETAQDALCNWLESYFGFPPLSLSKIWIWVSPTIPFLLGQLLSVRQL